MHLEEERLARVMLQLPPCPSPARHDPPLPWGPVAAAWLCPPVRFPAVLPMLPPSWASGLTLQPWQGGDRGPGQGRGLPTAAGPGGGRARTGTQACGPQDWLAACGPWAG